MRVHKQVLVNFDGSSKINCARAHVALACMCFGRSTRKIDVHGGSRPEVPLRKLLTTAHNQFPLAKAWVTLEASRIVCKTAWFKNANSTRQLQAFHASDPCQSDPQLLQEQHTGQTTRISLHAYLAPRTHIVHDMIAPKVELAI